MTQLNLIVVQFNTAGKTVISIERNFNKVALE